MTHHEINTVNLTVEAERLMTTARTATAQRAADTIYGDRDTVMRQTMLALLAGAELKEHDSPPEATLQVISGRVKLFGKDRGWELGAGDLMPIPPERHSLTALEDSVFVLTVLRATAQPIPAHHEPIAEGNKL